LFGSVSDVSALQDISYNMDTVSIGNIGWVRGSDNFPSNNLNMQSFLSNSSWVSRCHASVDTAWRSANTLHDINGDGWKDLIIGDPLKSKVYIFVGNTNNEFQNMKWAWRINGINTIDQFGFSVSSAKDTNGDGHEDLVIGMPNYGSSQQGGCVILFGPFETNDQQNNTNYNTNITALIASGKGLLITGGIASQSFGMEVISMEMATMILLFPLYFDPQV
jgi:hypothetical protein